MVCCSSAKSGLIKSPMHTGHMFPQEPDKCGFLKELLASRRLCPDRELLLRIALPHKGRNYTKREGEWSEDTTGLRASCSIWVEELTKYSCFGISLLHAFWCRTFHKSCEVQGDVGILTWSLEKFLQLHVPLTVLSFSVPATCGSS